MGRVAERLGPSARRIAGESAWLLGSEGISSVVALAQSVLVARALGPEQYGVLVMVTAFVWVLDGLTSWRMRECVVKYLSEALAQGRKDRGVAVVQVAVVFEAGASVVAFAAVLLGAPAAASWILRRPDGEELIRLFALAILAKCVSETAVGVLQTCRQFRLQAMGVTGGRLASLAAVVAVWAGDGGIAGFVTAYLVGTVVTAAVMTFNGWRELGRTLGSGWWRLRRGGLAGQWRAMGRFAVSTNVGATLSMITKESDTLWLGYVRSATEVGYYRLAFAVAWLVVAPVAPGVYTVYPELARRAATGDWAGFRRVIWRSTYAAAVYLLPAAVIAAMTGPWIISLVWGSGFAPAASALVVLLIGMIYASTLFWSSAALLALGRADLPTKVSACVAVLKLVGLFVVVPKWGYVGTAALRSGQHLLGVTMCSWLVRSEVRRREGGALR